MYVPIFRGLDARDGRKLRTDRHTHTRDSHSDDNNKDYTDHSHVENQCSKNLRILYFNARSLYPKLDELSAQCDIEKPDVVCLTETWLSEDIMESECAIPGYQCVRCDRNRHGGGIALYISNEFEFLVTMCGPKELEFLLVSLHNTHTI